MNCNKPDTKLTLNQIYICFNDKAVFNQTKTNCNIQVNANRNDCIENFSQFFKILVFYLLSYE